MKIGNIFLASLILFHSSGFVYAEDKISECGWTANGTWACVSYDNFPRSVEGNEKWCGVTPMLFQVEFNPDTTVAHCNFHKKRDCLVWANDAFGFGVPKNNGILGCHKNPNYDDDKDD